MTGCVNVADATALDMTLCPGIGSCVCGRLPGMIVVSFVVTGACTEF